MCRSVSFFAAMFVGGGKKMQELVLLLGRARVKAPIHFILLGAVSRWCRVLNREPVGLLMGLRLPPPTSHLPS